MLSLCSDSCGSKTSKGGNIGSLCSASDGCTNLGCMMTLPVEQIVAHYIFIIMIIWDIIKDSSYANIY